VRSGLAIPADATADTGAAPASTGQHSRSGACALQHGRGTRAVRFHDAWTAREQMLKALQSLREAAAPGELELF